MTTKQYVIPNTRAKYNIVINLNSEFASSLTPYGG